MTIETTWPEIFHKDNRLGWAFQARKDFINSFYSDEVKELFQFQERGGVNVAVYGRSQVGKTTLIIRLIGIAKSYSEYVAQILRGERKKGQSATSTAMVYKKSEDDYFYYKENEDKILKCNDDEMKECLKDLRSRIAKRQYTSTDCVEIKIPAKYFDSSIKNELKINIIDLPGVESDDPKEEIHIESLIDKYLPASNLILLIDRADQIEYFFSISLSQLKGWKYDPNRFRIILTRSVSNRSTQKKIRDMNPIDKESFRSIFKNAFGEQLPKEFLIYPLEYGESWEEMSAIDEQQELKSKVESLIDTLLSDIIDDINRITSIYQYLIADIKYYKRIEQIISDLRKEFSEKKDSLCLEMRKNIEFRVQLEKSINLCFSRKKDIENSFLHTESFSLFTFTFKSFQGEIKVSSLKNYLTYFFREITEKANKYVREHNLNYSVRIPEKMRFMDICEIESTTIINRLDNYLLDSYFSDKRYTDCRDCENTYKRVIKKIKEKIAKELDICLEKHNDRLSKELKEIEVKLSLYKDNYEISKTEASKLDKAIQLLETKYQEKKRSFEKDLETIKRFFQFIHNGFEQEWTKSWQKVNNAENTNEKVLEFCSLCLLHQEFTNLSTNYEKF